jgi:DNA polymerase-3 subunit gamma/tau
MRASASTSRVSTRRSSAPAWSASRIAVSNDATPAPRAPAETAATPASATARMEASSTAGEGCRPSRSASRTAVPGVVPSSRAAVADHAVNCRSAASSSPERR